MESPILAATAWKSNAHLIADVAALGYLQRDWLVLDPTYGLGRWWKIWRPEKLVFHDLHTVDGVDFRHLPHSDGMFDAVAFDPPYKLNGTPTVEVDQQYGVHEVRSWQERHELIRDGITECARVLKPRGYLLLKCQNQVSSGRVRWQVDEFTCHALNLGLEKVDQFEFLVRPRKQPPRTRADGEPVRQHHAWRNLSTLVVFRAPSATRVS